MLEVIASLFTAIASLANLILWICIVVAVWKYDIFSKLPNGIRRTLYTAMGVSGLFGLIAIA